MFSVCLKELNGYDGPPSQTHTHTHTHTHVFEVTFVCFGVPHYFNHPVHSYVDVVSMTTEMQGYVGDKQQHCGISCTETQ